MNLARYSFLAPLALLLACKTSPPKVQTQTDAGADFYAVQCSIINSSVEVVQIFPGVVCAYLDDGTVVSGTMKDLSAFGPRMELKWKKSYDSHHQIGVGLKGDTLLVLSSSFHRYRKRLVRFDVLKVLDLQGNELKSLDLFDRLQELSPSDPKQLDPIELRPDERRRDDVKYEFTHANSFYEIAINKYSDQDHAFAAGNYLVNENHLGVVFVLDHALKSILKVIPTQRFAREGLHDVQLLPSGELFFYNNAVNPPEAQPNSAVQRMDLSSGKIETLFKGGALREFYAEWGGGAQLLEDGSIITNDSAHGGAVHFVDVQGRLTRSVFNPQIDKRTQLPAAFFTFKKLDLSSFLKSRESANGGERERH